MALREAGLRDGVQADDPGAAVVRSESVVLDDRVHFHIRESGQDSDQRNTAHPFLLRGNDALGLLFGHVSTAQRIRSARIAGLFGKVYFPRLTAPISKVFSNLFSAGIQFATLAAFYVYYAATGAIVRPTWWAFAIPLLFVQLAALGTGFGMIVSALTTKYRDLRQLVGFGIGLWMYATPIVYPLSQVPAKYRWIMLVNPVTAPIETFRAAAYGVGGVSPGQLATSVAVTCVVLFMGLILFNHNERTFVDVV